MKADKSKFAFIIVLPFETNPAQHNGANDGSGIVGPDMQPNMAGQAYQKLYHQVIKTNINRGLTYKYTIHIPFAGVENLPDLRAFSYKRYRLCLGSV